MKEAQAERERLDAERGKAADELRKSEQQLRIITDSMPDVSEDGAVKGFFALTTDITRRKESERRTQLLQQITARLSEAVTPEQVADVIVENAVTVLGEHVGSVCLLDEDGQTIRAVNFKGIPAETANQYRSFPLSLSGPFSDAIRSREPVWVENLDAYLARCPHFEAAVRQNQSQAIIALPLIVQGRATGGISFSFRDPRPYTAEEADFLTGLANQCAQAMERARRTPPAGARRLPSPCRLPTCSEAQPVAFVLRLR